MFKHYLLLFRAITYFYSWGVTKPKHILLSTSVHFFVSLAPDKSIFSYNLFPFSLQISQLSFQLGTKRKQKVLFFQSELNAFSFLMQPSHFVGLMMTRFSGQRTSEMAERRGQNCFLGWNIEQQTKIKQLYIRT